MINYGCGVELGSLDECHMRTLRLWRNDYAIRKWTRQNDLISWDDQEKWFQKQASDPRTKMYAVVDKESGNMIGVCGLTSLDLVNRNAEFSLYIAPAFQRQGHGKKALKTLIAHGFQTYGLQVIYGESFHENPATKLFINVGFRKEGVRRNFYFRDGSFIDAHLFSILRDEYLESESLPKEQLCSSAIC